MAVQEERKYAIEAVLLERNPRKKSEKEIREEKRRVFCL